eukprot:UN11335
MCLGKQPCYPKHTNHRDKLVYSKELLVDSQMICVTPAHHFLKTYNSICGFFICW